MSIVLRLGQSTLKPVQILVLPILVAGIDSEVK